MSRKGADSSSRNGHNVHRDISLPRWHDEQITQRMTEQGIGRSEAIRQLVNESHQRGGRLVRLEIRQRVNTIKLNCVAARTKPSTMVRCLEEIENAADEIARLVAGTICL